MSDTLLIYYNIDTPAQASWALCNERGELSGKISHAALDELRTAAASPPLAGLPVVVLLHSACLHITNLQLPTQNMQKMLRAVPYAIEEYIAGDIEDFHFVISKIKDSSRTAVVGIEKNTLQHIVQVFSELGLFVEKIIPDALCLPADSSQKQWAALQFGDSIWLQSAELDGMVCNTGVFPYILSRKLQTAAGEETMPAKLLLFNEQEQNSLFDELGQQLTAEHNDLEVLRLGYNEHPMVVFCGNYKQAQALNLLQGKFKAKRKSSGYAQYWKLPAALAASALILHLGINSLEKNRLATQNKEMYAQIVRLYKSSFPQSRKIINPRKQMEDKLRELKGGGSGDDQDMLSLLAAAFGSLELSDSIELQSITFRNRRMDVSLQGKALSDIENLNRQLNQNSRISAEIVSSSSEKDRVSGNIRIERRESGGNRSKS